MAFDDSFENYLQDSKMSMQRISHENFPRIIHFFLFIISGTIDFSTEFEHF